MDNFFPFIYEPRKKEQEFESLYIEQIPLSWEKKKDQQKESTDERGVIIIQL